MKKITILLIMMLILITSVFAQQLENIGTETEPLWLKGWETSFNSNAIYCEGCESGNVPTSSAYSVKPLEELEEKDYLTSTFICLKDKCNMYIFEEKDIEACADYEELPAKKACLQAETATKALTDKKPDYILSHATAVLVTDTGKLAKLTVKKERPQGPYVQKIGNQELQLYSEDELELTSLNREKQETYTLSINSELKENRETLKIAKLELPVLNKGSKIELVFTPEETLVNKYTLFTKATDSETYYDYFCGNSLMQIQSGKMDGVTCETTSNGYMHISRNDEKNRPIMDGEFKLFIFPYKNENQVNTDPAMKIYFDQFSRLLNINKKETEDIVRIKAQSIRLGEEPEKDAYLGGTKVTYASANPSEDFVIKGNQIIVTSNDNHPVNLLLPIEGQPTSQRFILKSPSSTQEYSLIVRTGVIHESKGDGDIIAVPNMAGRNKDQLVQIWALNDKSLPRVENWNRIDEYRVSLINAILEKKLDLDAIVDRSLIYIIPMPTKTIEKEEIETDETTTSLGDGAGFCKNNDDCDPAEYCVVPKEGKPFCKPKFECQDDSECNQGHTCINEKCSCGSAGTMCNLNEMCINGVCRPSTLWELLSSACFGGQFISDMPENKRIRACNMYLTTLRHNAELFEAGILQFRHDELDKTSEELRSKYCSTESFEDYRIENQDTWMDVDIPLGEISKPQSPTKRGTFSYLPGGSCQITPYGEEDPLGKKYHPARDNRPEIKNVNIPKSRFTKGEFDNSLHFLVTSGDTLTKIVKSYNGYFTPPRTTKEVAAYNGIKYGTWKGTNRKGYFIFPGNDLEFPNPWQEKEQARKTIKEKIQKEVGERRSEEVTESLEKAQEKLADSGIESPQLPIMPLVAPPREEEEITGNTCTDDAQCGEGRECQGGTCAQVGVPEELEPKVEKESVESPTGRVTHNADLTLRDFKVRCFDTGRGVTVSVPHAPVVLNNVDLSYSSELAQTLEDGKIERLTKTSFKFEAQVTAPESLKIATQNACKRPALGSLKAGSVKVDEAGYAWTTTDIGVVLPR